MKLHGRITFFGEYLLKENLSYCLCIKSKLFLTNEINFQEIKHPTYSQNLDETIPILKQFGFNNFSEIFGNLPLGYGLSSSTILGLLHLSFPYRQDLIEIIDKKMNGFSPSELDFISITKQESGVYGFGNWLPLKKISPIYSLLIIPKERKRNLAEIKTAMSKTQKKQIELTKRLFKEILLTGDLDFLLFLEYCELLLSNDVYSEYTAHIVRDLLGKGIPCKCIGGLYDKGILVLYTDNSSKKTWDKYISDKYNLVTVVE